MGEAKRKKATDNNPKSTRARMFHLLKFLSCTKDGNWYTGPQIERFINRRLKEK
jgi:hypothetical protein